MALRADVLEPVHAAPLISTPGGNTSGRLHLEHLDLPSEVVLRYVLPLADLDHLGSNVVPFLLQIPNSRTQSKAPELVERFERRD